MVRSMFENPARPMLMVPPVCPGTGDHKKSDTFTCVARCEL